MHCNIAPIHKTPLPLGLATMTLSITLDVRPFAMRPFCASQVTGGFFTFSTQTEESSRYRQPETATSAGHEPVCLVPGSVDKYLHVPESTLQLRLDTHSEGFLLC